VTSNPFTWPTINRKEKQSPQLGRRTRGVLRQHCPRSLMRLISSSVNVQPHLFDDLGVVSQPFRKWSLTSWGGRTVKSNAGRISAQFNLYPKPTGRYSAFQVALSASNKVTYGRKKNARPERNRGRVYSIPYSKGGLKRSPAGLFPKRLAAISNTQRPNEAVVYFEEKFYTNCHY